MSLLLKLDELREKLRRMEDSVILGLFERKQFKLNEAMYKPGEISIPNFQGSFLDFLLEGTERLHALAGRYEHPDEHPFTSGLPIPIIPRRKEDNPLKANNVNVNPLIKEIYLNHAVRNICEPGDDNQYGSCAVIDICLLQNLSARIHFGEKVAESKFEEDPKAYTELIKARDEEGIVKRLRDEEAEKRVFIRVREKGLKYNVNPDVIESFYREQVIPLTIQVEVEYLKERLEPKRKVQNR